MPIEMIYTTHVTGDMARKYPEYAYRERIGKEFNLTPADAGEQATMAKHYRDIAIVKVQFQDSDVKGLDLVTVKLVPTKYTAARKPRIVCEFKVSNANLHAKQYICEAISFAFGAEYGQWKPHHIGDNYEIDINQ